MYTVINSIILVGREIFLITMLKPSATGGPAPSSPAKIYNYHNSFSGGAIVINTGSNDYIGNWRSTRAFIMLIIYFHQTSYTIVRCLEPSGRIVQQWVYLLITGVAENTPEMRLPG